MGIALVLYVLLSLVVTGIVPYVKLNTPSPVTDAFNVAGLPLIATNIAIGAVASLLSVLFAFMLSTSRIWFAVSRDGLLPRWFARSHQVPHALPTRDYSRRIDCRSRWTVQH